MHGEASEEASDPRPTRILSASNASQHAPPPLVNVSLECVTKRACQTTRRGCAWRSGTQSDARLPANRIAPSYLEGRL